MMKVLEPLMTGIYGLVVGTDYISPATSQQQVAEKGRLHSVLRILCELVSVSERFCSCVRHVIL